jgi:hypothetical protein
MVPDLETCWIAASGEERAWYLGSAWRAADDAQRAEVLREAGALLWLAVAWRACDGRERREFVALRAREIATALDEALLRPPPDRPLRAESKQALARRLNFLEQRFPEMAEMIKAWRRMVGVPLSLKRSLPTEKREQPAKVLHYRNPNRPRGRGRPEGAARNGGG